MEIRTYQNFVSRRYVDMRETFGKALLDGSHNAGSTPRDGDAPWGASLIIRLSHPMAKRLAEVADTCCHAARGPVLRYRADELHITVRSLEGYRAHSLTEVRREELCCYVTDSITGVSPFQIQLRGLSGGGDTLFACGYAEPGLTQIRNALHFRRHQIGSTGPTSLDAARIRDTAHASLVLFRQQPEAEPDIATILDDYADVDFGTELVRELTLVEYTPNTSSVGMTSLATFALQ